VQHQRRGSDDPSICTERGAFYGRAVQPPKHFFNPSSSGFARFEPQHRYGVPPVTRDTIYQSFMAQPVEHALGPSPLTSRTSFSFYTRNVMNRSRVRLIGLIVLVLGLASAECIYWFGERAAEKTGTKDSDELANSIQLENQRKADREIEMGFGKAYVMVIHAEDWWTTLPAYKQVAFVIAAAAVAVATTCFILSAALRV